MMNTEITMYFVEGFYLYMCQTSQQNIFVNLPAYWNSKTAQTRTNCFAQNHLSHCLTAAIV